jgi:hypothetical protein
LLRSWRLPVEERQEGLYGQVGLPENGAKRSSGQLAVQRHDDGASIGSAQLV